MQISETSTDGVSIHALAGRLDAEATPALEACLAATQANGPNDVLLDLEHLIYITSEGIRALVKNADALRRAKRRFILIKVPELIFDVFEINDIDSKFEFAPSRDEAVELVRPPESGAPSGDA